MRQSPILHSPAKLNLRLKVVGRRGDGFHLLDMLNATVSLFDDITITLENSGLEIISGAESGIFLPADINDPEKNLAGRAFRAFCNAFGIQAGARIELLKRIPLGAGLGGGSSNAAAVLNWLSRCREGEFRKLENIEPQKLTNRLCEIAISLGSDVPYLLNGRLSRVQGIGEIVTPLGNADSIPVFLLVPPFGLESKKVYDALRQNRARFAEDTLLPGFSRRIHEFAQLQPAERVAELLSLVENDLEAPAISLSPELGSILTDVRNLNTVVSGMTGSGSVVFAIPKYLNCLEEEIQGQLSVIARRYKLVVHSVTILANK